LELVAYNDQQLLTHVENDDASSHHPSNEIGRPGD
jgi:hypothetical protein